MKSKFMENTESADSKHRKSADSRPVSSNNGQPKGQPIGQPKVQPIGRPIGQPKEKDAPFDKDKAIKGRKLFITFYYDLKRQYVQHL